MALLNALGRAFLISSQAVFSIILTRPSDTDCALSTLSQTGHNKCDRVLMYSGQLMPRNC
jgi:hypothetical protein